MCGERTIRERAIKKLIEGDYEEFKKLIAQLEDAEGVTINNLLMEPGND
ncbi:hypothetical protein [Pediococcus pentosaceus]